MDSPRLYDLIVVGAGPAGSEAARRGAELGAKTLLIERATLPRAKLCGGWLSIQALNLLDQPLPANLVEAPFTSARLTIDSVAVDHHNPDGFGVFVDRAQFDAWLAQRAVERGAEIVRDTAMRLEVDDPLIVACAGGRYSARSVVITTGAEGALTRFIRPPDPPHHSALGLECLIATTDLSMPDLPPGGARFEFGFAAGSFTWCLHHGDTIYLGIGGIRDTHKVLLDRMRSLLSQHAHSTAKINGHLIPVGGYRRRLGRGRILLAGDAAGFVDPFTGEGIACALQSGRIAAETLMIDLPGFDPVKHYERITHHEFGANLMWSLRLKRLLHRYPGLRRRLLADRRSFDALLEVLAGRQSYARFARRIFWQQLIPGRG